MFEGINWKLLLLYFIPYMAGKYAQVNRDNLGISLGIILVASVLFWGLAVKWGYDEDK